MAFDLLGPVGMIGPLQSMIEQMPLAHIMSLGGVHIGYDGRLSCCMNRMTP